MPGRGFGSGIVLCATDGLDDGTRERSAVMKAGVIACMSRQHYLFLFSPIFASLVHCFSNLIFEVANARLDLLAKDNP